MNELARFKQLNLWDVPVLEVKLIREHSGEFNVEAKLEVPKSLVPGADADAPARLVFKNCHDFKASIDVSLWSRLGPEFGDQAATVISTTPFRARYVLGLRETGSIVEIVAVSFLYEGPDILVAGAEKSRDGKAQIPRVRDILGRE